MDARPFTPTSTRTPGEVITFYSYKGGTGRTMSMVNLACLLADKLPYGERILLIDWDLEAPGLHRYFHDRLRPARLRGQSAPMEPVDDTNDFPGLIDLFVQLRESGNKPEIKRKRKQEVRATDLLDTVNFNDYILSTHVPNLDLIKAGRFDAGYGTRVSTFAWEALYDQYPLAFRELAERLTQQYRYVFIDSRTGQTDTAGICTTLMPEKLVLVFTPNRQSLYGIEKVLKDAVAYRRRDQDSRPLVAYPLPSRVEVAQDNLRAIWRFGDSTKSLEGYEPLLTRALKEAYDLRHCHLRQFFNEVQIKQSPVYAFGEEIAVLNERIRRVEDDYSLTRAYQNLLEWLEPGFLPWESPEAIRLMRSIENRVRAKSIETQALTEDLRALRTLAKRLANDGDSGNHELAIRTGERHARRHLGESHAESLAYANEITTLLIASNKLSDARMHAEKTRQLCSTHLGEEDQETLTAMDNLAVTLHAEGDLTNAFELEKSVLAERRRILGDEHPGTLISMNNLASILWAQGDIVGALDLEKSTLEMQRRTLGEEHPDTLTSMSNLASILWAQDDIAGALELEKSVLKIRRRTFGEEHPDTLTSMSNLASTLHAQDNLTDALKLQKSALEIQQRTLGDKHQDTIISAWNLFTTARKLNDTTTAKDMLEKYLLPLLQADPDGLSADLRTIRERLKSIASVGARPSPDTIHEQRSASSES